MNATQSRPVNLMLDPEWVVAIQEQLDTYPASAIALIVEPDLMGRFDGEMGNPCDPTRYYARLGDVESYIIGWKDAAAILAAAIDYEDDIEDRAYWSRGQW